MQENVNGSATNEGTVKVIQEFEKIIKNERALLYG